MAGGQGSHWHVEGPTIVAYGEGVAQMSTHECFLISSHHCSITNDVLCLLVLLLFSMVNRFFNIFIIS